MSGRDRSATYPLGRGGRVWREVGRSARQARGVSGDGERTEGSRRRQGAGTLGVGGASYGGGCTSYNGRRDAGEPTLGVGGAYPENSLFAASLTSRAAVPPHPEGVPEPSPGFRTLGKPTRAQPRNPERVSQRGFPGPTLSGFGEMRSWGVPGCGTLGWVMAPLRGAGRLPPGLVREPQFQSLGCPPGIGDSYGGRRVE